VRGLAVLLVIVGLMMLGHRETAPWALAAIIGGMVLYGGPRKGQRSPVGTALAALLTLAAVGGVIVTILSGFIRLP
jgi:hypothetical protein